MYLLFLRRPHRSIDPHTIISSITFIKYYVEYFKRFYVPTIRLYKRDNESHKSLTQNTLC